MRWSFSSCWRAGGLVRADGEPEVDGAHDRARIAPLLLAPVVERGVAGGEDSGARNGHVPAVGVARDDAQQALLALPADPQPQPSAAPAADRRSRRRSVDVLAVEGDALAVEERRSTIAVSSSWSRRSLIGRNGMPKARNSFSFQPAPSPSSQRPPLR